MCCRTKSSLHGRYREEPYLNLVEQLQRPVRISRDARGMHGCVIPNDRHLGRQKSARHQKSAAKTNASNNTFSNTGDSKRAPSRSTSTTNGIRSILLQQQYSRSLYDAGITYIIPSRQSYCKSYSSTNQTQRVRKKNNKKQLCNTSTKHALLTVLHAGVL